VTAKKKERRAPKTPDRARRGWYIAVTTVLAVLILINMTVIFQFSSASREESGELSEGLTRKIVGLLYRGFEDLPAEEQRLFMQKAHKFVRKAAHFSEFALLGLLSACLLLYISSALRKLKPWLTLTTPAVFTLLYAISDEVHQIFSGRGPRVTDVLIDFAGAVCGILLIHGIAYLITRRKKGSKSAVKKKRRRRHEPCETPATD
jgi:VanZ family protein